MFMDSATDSLMRTSRRSSSTLWLSTQFRISVSKSDCDLFCDSLATLTQSGL